MTYRSALEMKYPATDQWGWDLSREAMIEIEIDRLVTLARGYNDRALACEIIGKLGRAKYFRRRRDFLNAKAVGLKMGAA